MSNNNVVACKLYKVLRLSYDKSTEVKRHSLVRITSTITINVGIRYDVRDF